MSIYTDLAREAREINPDIPGITEEEETYGDISVSRITVESLSAANALGKPMGRYVTIEAAPLVNRDTSVFREVGGILAKELERLLPGGDASALIIGLGNRGVTADALGPRVVERAFVTRHITQHLPDIIGEPMRAVAAFAPGVLGVTGVETLEMLLGVVERVKPGVAIAVDALASRRAQRISTAIQITDTGIHPGSGVGNMRMGVTKDTLGVPVVAIGVPTVVYASTILHDALALLQGGGHMDGDIERLVSRAGEAADGRFASMIVTPKEIDTIITDMAGILADGLNLALHRPYYGQIEELLA